MFEPYFCISPQLSAESVVCLLGCSLCENLPFLTGTSVTIRVFSTAIVIIPRYHVIWTSLRRLFGSRVSESIKPTLNSCSKTENSEFAKLLTFQS